MIQDEPDVIHCKPNVSETPVTHGKEFCRGPKKIEIPNNYCPSPTLFSLQDDARADIKMNDAAWLSSRLDLSKNSNYVINAFGVEQTMPGRMECIQFYHISKISEITASRFSTCNSTSCDKIRNSLYI